MARALKLEKSGGSSLKRFGVGNLQSAIYDLRAQDVERCLFSASCAMSFEQLARLTFDSDAFPTENLFVSAATLLGSDLSPSKLRYKRRLRAQSGGNGAIVGPALLLQIQANIRAGSPMIR